jgi:hypothetical protein
MKKMILIAIAAIATQQASAQFSLNPEAGLNFSNVSNGGKNNKMKIGYKVGVMANLGIYKGFYIEPGIMYSVKGYRTQETVLGITTKSTATLNYLEIPLNLGYQYDMGSAGGVFVSAGPYLGIGMSGTSSGSMGAINVDDKIKFGDGAAELKKMDVGMNFSLGYVSPIGIYVRAQYGMGLTNLSNTSVGTWKNSPVLGLSLGYIFQLNEK